MTQYGAYGRASAGQTYQQILAHYYTGTTLGSIDVTQTVRVRLTVGYMPTPELPARVVARTGAWTSTLFPELVFPTDSYADMDPQLDGTWVANVYDAAGLLLATSPTVDGLLMQPYVEPVVEPAIPLPPTTMFEMKFRDSLRKYDLYRGLMQMRVTATGLQTINHVRMDDYLKGVVPAEVPASWPKEAVRAQAVAARNYAMTHLKPTGFWDLQPTAANQVYGGVKIEHPKSNQAVVDTSRVVVLAPNGSLANTYFFATAGGHTENNEYAWPNDAGKVVGTPISYLRGVPDLNPNGVPYDVTASDSSWSTASFSWEQLQQILAADGRTNVGTLTSLTFKRGVSGRVYQAILVGTAGTKTVNGAIFENIYNRNPAGGTKLLKSTCFYLEPVPVP